MTTPTSSSGYSLFCPLLVLIGGFAVSLTFQVVNLEGQRAEISQANEEIKSQVESAGYQQAKRQNLAHDILQLARTDSNAAEIVNEFKIKEVPAAEGALSAPVKAGDGAK
jgi:hypothetical protein